MFTDLINFQHVLSPEAWVAFGKVVFIDLVLAGDNAIVIGMAAAGLPAAQRGRAILLGVIAATVLRIIFAVVAIELLKVVGLILLGGLLLLWVCWKMWVELREHHAKADLEEVISGADIDGDGKVAGQPKGKTLGQAALQIVVADISMSLDNVLAVAGAAREHPFVLVIGLVLSVALMGLAASFIARVLEKYRWVAYVGLAIILYVALEMCYNGGMELLPLIQAKLA